MRRLATVVLLVTGATLGPMALPAAAEQPDRVRLHVQTNHESGIFTPGGNERSAGPGATFGKYTKCFLYVINPDQPSCWPE